MNCYLVKLLPDGSDLAWAKYFGGAGGAAIDSHQLAVDARNNVYLCGGTTAADLPTTRGAFQRRFAGLGKGLFQSAGDALVAKFSPTGGLLACTYLGGADGEVAFGIGLDAGSNVYVSGGTVSTDFPPAGNSFQTANKGNMDFFVCKLSPDLGRLLYSSYLGTVGGTSFEQARDLCVTAGGDLCVVGDCPRQDGPTLNAYQASPLPGLTYGMVLTRFAPAKPAPRPSK